MADTPKLKTFMAYVTNSDSLIITLVVIILVLLVLFGWIFDRLGLKERSCTKLDIYYPKLTNQSYFNNGNIMKSDARTSFDNSNNIHTFSMSLFFYCFVVIVYPRIICFHTISIFF